VTVTLLKVVDPAPPLYAFEVPGAGLQYAAVQLQLTNSGTVPLTDSMQADTRILAAGQAYDAIVYDVSGCPSFLGGTLSLGPGGSDSGCVVFEVPAGVPIQQVDFGLGGSRAATVALWKAS
jgi:hypothetical protein